MEMRFRLEKETWGEVQFMEEEVGDVLYVVTSMPPFGGKELYVVLPGAVPEVISKEALSYGTEIPGGYVFEMDVKGSGWEIISYELARHKLRQEFTAEGREELYAAAVYAAEKYPAYFGGILPPRSTPWGAVLRHKKVAEGLYFLETDGLVWVLAVAEPIWEVDLSEDAKWFGQLWEQDRLLGRKEAQYFYFRAERCVPVIYELLEYEEYQGFISYISSKAALETRLYLDYPEYTFRHNFVQMTGRGKSDMLRNLASAVGAWDLTEEASSDLDARRMRCCICFTPELVHAPVLLLPQ